MFTMHACFSKMRTPQPAFGHVAILIKNRQLFLWGVCWSRGASSPEIFAFTVFTTQNGWVNVLSDRKKKLWFESYSYIQINGSQWSYFRGVRYKKIKNKPEMYETCLQASLTLASRLVMILKNQYCICSFVVMVFQGSAERAKGCGCLSYLKPIFCSMRAF